MSRGGKGVHNSHVCLSVGVQHDENSVFLNSFAWIVDAC